MKALSRLQQLPPVFTTKDLMDFGLSRAAAHTTAMRWSRLGLIAAAGPRAAIYFNLLVDPQGARNRVLQAVALLDPSAVVVGAAVLHAHGWTTQIPTMTEVAVLDNRKTIKEIHGVRFVFRSAKWYQGVFSSILRGGHEGESPFDIPSLAPRAALDDALASTDLWRPDPDDIDVPQEHGDLLIEDLSDEMSACAQGTAVMRNR